MPSHAIVAAVLAVVLVIVAAPGALADADATCLEAPGAAAPQGAHWHYHSDLRNNRKCWHLGGGAAPPAPPRHDRGTASLGSVLAPLVREVRSMFRQPMPHERLAGEPRIVQSDATRLLTIDDIARQPEFPEERAEPRPVPFLNGQQRRTLYDEYLKWEALQRNGPASAPAP